MTGEMHISEVTREAYPIHFALADALGPNARVLPFDHYQGPYVYATGVKLWVVCAGDGSAVLYDEETHTQSESFTLLPDAPEIAAALLEDMVDWLTPEDIEAAAQVARLNRDRLTEAAPDMLLVLHQIAELTDAGDRVPAIINTLAHAAIAKAEGR